MQADISLLKKIGYKQSINFEQGLKRTIKWYRNFLKVYINDRGNLNKLSEYD